GVGVNDGQIHHVVAIAEAGLPSRIYIDGQLSATSGNSTLGNNDQQVRIGENPDATGREWEGMIDDVAIWGRALTDDEIQFLFENSLGESEGVISQPTTNLIVTADSTLEFTSLGDAVLGNLTMADGVTLTAKGAAGSFSDVNGGNGSTLLGDVIYRGTLNAAVGVTGQFSVDGELEAEDDATLVAEFGPADNDLVTVTGDALLSGALMLGAVDRVPPPGQQWGDTTGRTMTVMQTSGESVIELEDAVLQTAGTHIGHGVFLTSDVVAEVLNFETELQVTADYFQAAPGDTDGDRDVDGDDIQNILAANTFPRRNPAEWPSGDFTGDGLCDGDDIQQILAAALFGTGSYAAGSAEAGEDPGLQLIVTPDGLVIDTGDATINGYVLTSEAGVFTGDAAENLGVFQEDEDGRISGNFAFTLSGTHLLGDVIGEEFAGVDLQSDLSLTYTVEGAGGVYQANVVVPEPATLI
ncbi:MAG: hypothetical protein GTO22_20750, partial [Gemmatimonadales bacterium]|nr:hypothetical protein [Gemmatimonadales bacterium]